MPSAGPARPHPSLNAMLLCDLTIREHGTGKISLIGVFENISAATFPVVHRTLSVYAKLADAEGDYAIKLELVRLDDSHVVAQGTLKAAFANRMTPGELIFNLENLAFERAGRYEFRLYADERFVAGKSFTVVPAGATTTA
ncbi:MAG: hypothetical protein E6K82_04640 [Candidatus Rokuibacteriota bacterium]|nr:MAG: hypothetical protein E6K82_04640 [Candidatus Rokubacteria bacterium]